MQPRDDEDTRELTALTTTSTAIATRGDPHLKGPVAPAAVEATAHALRSLLRVPLLVGLAMLGRGAVSRLG